MLRVFSLLGDSNIQRHVNKTSCRATPELKGAQILPCGHLGIFADSLKKVKPATTICILSCLTNFLASAEGPPPVSHRIESVLGSIKTEILEFCATQPDRLCLVAPPM